MSTNDPVNVRLELILKIFEKDTSITREELARKCEVSIETTKRDIKKLKEKGLIKRRGSDKTDYLEIIQ